jgi:hypothetical protein
MSHTISEALLPMLHEAFPQHRMQLGPQAHILATYQSPNREVGCVAIQDDGDEITLFLADKTHLHFGNYDDSLSEKEKAQDIAGQVVAFLGKLFADQIEFYGNGASGGCHERNSKQRGIISKLLAGAQSYVWSGPLSQRGDASQETPAK